MERVRLIRSVVGTLCPWGRLRGRNGVRAMGNGVRIARRCGNERHFRVLCMSGGWRSVEIINRDVGRAFRRELISIGSMEV